MTAIASGSPGPRPRPLLFNPGPTNVHEEVRQALLVPDTCHRESEFAAELGGLLDDLVTVLGGAGTHACVPFVSSGTGANEAILAGIRGRLLILVAGHYSARILAMAHRLGVQADAIEFDPHGGIDLRAVERACAARSDLTHVFAVHHETTTGVLAPLHELGALCARRGLLLAVDGISSVGSHPFHLQRDRVDLCSLNANKCLESVPGIAFVLARLEVLESLVGCSRSYYFDLHAQWLSLRESGLTPFTTATQLVSAARLAVRRLVAEGYDARVARYARLRRRLLDGLLAVGLSPVPIPPDKASNLHVLIHQPAGLTYAQLHDELLDRGFLIYSDRATIERGHLILATMGAIDESEVDLFLAALACVLRERLPAR